MFNWYGVYSLIKKENIRFYKVYNQTIISPSISALTFLAIFTLALDEKKNSPIPDVSFINFMSYGLIIMVIIQNAFANSSSSITTSKVLGYINDILIPPLGSTEIILAYTISSMFRGLTVGLITLILFLPFADFHIQHFWYLLFFIFTSCSLLGMLGILVGVSSNSFDQSSSITNYIINPLSFLSGTFYSVKKLPYIIQKINIFNPFYYIIDGFRYSLTDYANSDLNVGIIIMITINPIIFILLKYLIDKGWRLKN